MCFLLEMLAGAQERILVRVEMNFACIASQDVPDVCPFRKLDNAVLVLGLSLLEYLVEVDLILVRMSECLGERNIAFSCWQRRRIAIFGLGKTGPAESQRLFVIRLKGISTIVVGIWGRLMLVLDSFISNRASLEPRVSHVPLTIVPL